jgi:cell division protein FtsB
MVEPDRLNRKTPSGFGSSATQSRSSCLRRIVAAVKSPRKLLSMSSDFVALLAGIVGVIFTGVGVVALYVSATNAQKQIAKETTRADTLAKETEELKAKKSRS